MDPQLPFTSRDDLWQIQNDMQTIYATQAELLDRLSRLERRQEDDTRLKSVWGHASPFPSVLNGNSQQDFSYNPAAEAFKNFDQDQTPNTLGSLQLEADDEPRRGTSRANSVRFDESALHGHFTQGSRSSNDLFPLRTGSGLGSHPMTERSSSHKSDGRQSSAGVSTQSAQLNSLNLDVRQPAHGNTTPAGPPPGLFILGACPSIIRCWLDTNFSNDSLLYAAICTGSCKSVLGLNLITRLGLHDQTTIRGDGERTAKLRVYLPEATIQHSSARSNCPPPQLPVLTVDFLVYDFSEELDGIQLVIGSDILRLRNADVLFSQDRLTILDDTRNKLAVPLVRPEKRALYQDLRTLNCASEQRKTSLDFVSTPSVLDGSIHMANGQDHQNRIDVDQSQNDEDAGFLRGQSSCDVYTPNTKPTGQIAAIGEERASTLGQAHGELSTAIQLESRTKVVNGSMKNAKPDTPIRAEVGSIWGSWRRDSGQHTRQELTFSNIASTSSYQKAGRGRGMKVLKPARANPVSRSTPTASTPSNLESETTLPSDNSSSGSQALGGDLLDVQSVSPPKRPLSVEVKSPLQSLTNKPRSANPVGGASAFGWLNPSQPRRTSTSAE